MRVVALSGPIAAGKTTLATEMVGRLRSPLLDVAAVLREKLQDRSTPVRSDLRALGDAIDQETRGRWMVDYIGELPQEPNVPVVVDAVRRLTELDALRAEPSLEVFHVYLDAPRDILRTRFTSRGRDSEAYESVSRHPSEAALPLLKELADVVLDSSQAGPDELCDMVIALGRH